jgi:hypothetical protein
VRFGIKLRFCGSAVVIMMVMMVMMVMMMKGCCNKEWNEEQIKE